jgi:hypothetical protein
LSIEYGLTAALTVALVVVMAMGVQSSLAAHYQTKCYTLGSELVSNKI